VEDQGSADQTEGDARLDERHQESGREARKDKERSAPRGTPHPRGHPSGVHDQRVDFKRAGCRNACYGTNMTGVYAGVAVVLSAAAGLSG